jgi:hypothetical protein
MDKVDTEMEDPVRLSNVLQRLWLSHYVGANLTKARDGTLKPSGWVDRVNCVGCC